MPNPGLWARLSLWVQRNAAPLSVVARACVVLLLASAGAVAMLHGRDQDIAPFLQFSLFYAGVWLMGCLVLAETAYAFDPDLAQRHFPSNAIGRIVKWGVMTMIAAQLALFVTLVVALPWVYWVRP